MDFGIARSADRPADAAARRRRRLRATGPSGLSRTAVLAARRRWRARHRAHWTTWHRNRRAARPVDQRADIYAFGLILHDMFLAAARPGVHGKRRRRISSSGWQTAPPPPRSGRSHRSRGGRRNHRRCLEPDPAKRFQTTVELKAALDRLDDDGKPLPIVRRLTRRTMAVAAVLVLLLLGGTFYATRQLSAPPTEHAPVARARSRTSRTPPTIRRSTTRSARHSGADWSLRVSSPRSTARGCAATFGVAAPEIFDEVAARQLAIKQGLGVVLAGSIAPRGSGYDITVKATEPMTGKVITSVPRRAANKDQVLTAVTRVVTSIRNALGDETSDSAQQLAMKTISTTSLEVASHYAAAMNAQSRGNAEEALASFAKAVEMDPKFGLGYQGLAVMSRNMGRLQDAEKYCCRGAAVSRRHDRARALRDARVLLHSRRATISNASREYGELIARYPADVPAHNQRASCLARLRDMRGAVDEMRQVVSHPAQPPGLQIEPRGRCSTRRASSRPRRRRSARSGARRSGAGRAGAEPAGTRPGPRSSRDLPETRQDGRLRAHRSGPPVSRIWPCTRAASRRRSKIFEDGAAADLDVKNADAAAMKYAALAYAHLASGQRSWP